MAEAQLFTARVHGLYDSLDGCPIHPFVGRNFLQSSNALRVVAVGINSYVDEKDWKPPHPDWFPTWFQNGEWHFSPRVLSEVRVVADALRSSSLFGSYEFADRDSIYLTNAIKVYLRTEDGRHDHQIPTSEFERFEKTWRDELELMAEHRVLPHVVIVFGERPWAHVWPAFKQATGGKRHLQVRTYESVADRLPHRLNFIEVGTSDDVHSLLLMRLTHPAAQTNRYRAAEMIAHPEFRRIAQVGPS